MGHTTWSTQAYAATSRSYETKTRAEIFTLREQAPELKVEEMTVRECRDSEAHPDSRGILVFLDVTGSMGKIPELLVRGELGTLMETLHQHDLPDAAIMFGGIGDHYTDSSALQVSQFESGDKELDHWLKRIHIEGRGGGNGGESYPLAWLFASRHISMDCLDKRGVKGFLFTIGDEAPHDTIEFEGARKFLGYSEAPGDFPATTLLEVVKDKCHVFHIHVEHDDRALDARTAKKWGDLLGENFLVCKDYHQVAKLIADTIALVTKNEQ